MLYWYNNICCETLAQSVEHTPFKRRVEGSNPSCLTIKKSRRCVTFLLYPDISQFYPKAPMKMPAKVSPLTINAFHKKCGALSGNLIFIAAGDAITAARSKNKPAITLCDSITPAPNISKNAIVQHLISILTISAVFRAGVSLS